jgi:hypothetical protein
LATLPKRVLATRSRGFARSPSPGRAPCLSRRVRNGRYVADHGVLAGRLQRTSRWAGAAGTSVHVRVGREAG